LAFAEGLFLFINYFSEKEGFLILRVEYNSNILVIVILTFIYNKKVIQLNNLSKES